MGLSCGWAGDVFQENMFASRLVAVRGGGFGGNLSILLHFDALNSVCTLSGDEEGCFRLYISANRFLSEDVEGCGLDD
jgi:hypothetical protein